MTTESAETRNDELGLVLAAVMFYSRLRVPAWTPYSEDILNRSRKYFPLVGILIGLIAAVVYGLAVRVLGCLLYTSPSPRDQRGSRMPSSA